MSWFKDHVVTYQPSYVRDDINKGFKNGRLELIEDEVEEVPLILEIKDGSANPPRDEPRPQ